MAGDSEDDPGVRIIDPRDFIHGPYRTCPSCSSKQYGVLMVNRYSVRRRCRECWHTDSERLPPVEKRIIYLDQMAVSNMVKALDPEYEPPSGSMDPYWLKLFKRLDILVKLQWIACPSSTIHERESVMVPDFALYRRLYEHLSAGVEFDHHLLVYRRQLHHALEAWSHGEKPGFSEINRPAVLRGGRLDGWLERLQVSVNFSIPEHQVEGYRDSRNQRHTALKNYMDAARASDGQEFDDWYEETRTVHGTHIVESFLDRARHLRDVATGQEPFGEKTWNPTIFSSFLPGIADDLKRRGVDGDVALEKAVEFFHSEAAMNAPFNEIRALLTAALARKAASGQKKVGRGTPNDLDVLSTVLPYVDAIFTDNQFAGLLGEEPVASRLPSDARVFSNRTRDQFLTFLDELRDDVPSEHEERVLDVYGEGWLEPFVGVIEHERGSA